MAEAPRPGAATASLILGSASPRRADLLARLGRPFVVRSCTIDERSHVSGDVSEAARKVARAKYEALAGDLDSGPDTLLIAADTLVAFRQMILGKPDDDDEATATLRAMSGQSLRIVTGVCVGKPGSEPTTCVVETVVELRTLDEPEIAGYVATGEPRDKAGGLALQGGAASFVRRVDGCWSNVVGLPLCAVTAMLDGDDRPDASRRRCSVDLCGAHR